MQLVRAAILDRLLVDRASRRHSDRINMYIYTLRYFFFVLVGQQRRGYCVRAQLMIYDL